MAGTLSVVERIKEIEKRLDIISTAYDRYVEVNSKEAAVIAETLGKLETKLNALEVKVVGIPGVKTSVKKPVPKKT
jgi:septation ring formation regulator EzrA